ncbi:MAG: hypothetical protein ACLRU3_02180 [Paraclostridium sp.]
MVFIELGGYISAKCLNIDESISHIKSRSCSISKCISHEFANLSEIEDINEYINTIKDQWDKISIKNLRKIYNRENLVAYNYFDGIECYIFREDLVQDRNNIFVKILLFIEKDDIDYSINTVHKKINKKIKGMTLNIFKNKKLRFCTNRNVKVYLYNEYSREIIYETQNEKAYIEVELKKSQILDKYTIVRNIITFALCLICITISIIKSDNDTLKNIMYGISASAVFSMVLEIVSIIVEWVNTKYTISIKNISTLAQDQARQRQVEREVPMGTQDEVDDQIIEDPEL